MTAVRRGLVVAAVLLLAAFVALRWWAGTGEAPAELVDGELDLPVCDGQNCVSSDARTPEERRVEALACSFDAAFVAVLDLERSRLVREETYGRADAEDGSDAAEPVLAAHIEVRTRWLGFTDDLVLRGPAEGPVDVWSGSRLGEGDLGVNADRVTAIRSACA